MEATRVAQNNSLLTADFALTSNAATPLDVTGARKACFESQVTVGASTAKTFTDSDVDVTANTITKAAHGWASGRKVAATTSGVLPGGLSATDYYIIPVDANTISLASSYANAIAGTAVDITSAAGGGTHTLTPAALAGATVKLQASIDPCDGSVPAASMVWIDVASGSNNITVTANFMWSIDNPGYRSARLIYTLTAGQISVITRGMTVGVGRAS